MQLKTEGMENMVHLLIGIAAGIIALSGAAKVVDDIIIKESLTKRRMYEELVRIDGSGNRFKVDTIDKYQNRIKVSDLDTGRQYTISGSSISDNVRQGDILGDAVRKMADENIRHLSSMTSNTSEKKYH